MVQTRVQSVLSVLLTAGSLGLLPPGAPTGAPTLGPQQEGLPPLEQVLTQVLGATKCILHKRRI